MKLARRREAEGRPESGSSKLGGVVHGTAITKPTMGSACIVVDAEVLNDDPGLREGPQLFAVETFITKAAWKDSTNPFCQGLAGSM